MQHTVEEVSPVKKKIAVTVPASEVDAVLDRTTKRYRQRVTLPGFRKGKAPMGMVEKRFTQDIFGEAVNDLVNANVSEILREMKLEPLGNLSFEDTETPMARGKDFSYAFSFEIMPEISLPEYDGIGVAEEEVTVEDKEIDEVIDRLRRGMAEKTAVEEKRLPRDSDVVVMDFTGFDENGEPVPGVSGEQFQVAIGDGQVIPDFETLARSVMPGDSGEGAVVFPEDYGHKPLAGKTVNMKITVHSLMERKMPEVDDEFAKKAGGFDTVDALRSNVRETYARNRKEMAKAKGQRQLLENLLEKIEFPLPEGMVNQYAENALHGRLEEMNRQGKDMAALTEEEFGVLREDTRKEAEKYAKTQLFLLTVAKAENLNVSGQEITAALRQIAARGRHDFKEVQEHYARNNLYPALRDRLLADKAMDAMYEKAAGKKAEPKGEESGDDAKTD